MNSNNILLLIVIAALMIMVIVKGIKWLIDQIPYWTQAAVTKRNSQSQKEVTYEEFLKMFQDHTWYIKPSLAYSFFSPDHDDSTMFHKGIWKIEDVGILPKDYETFDKIILFLINLWKYILIEDTFSSYAHDKIE